MLQYSFIYLSSFLKEILRFEGVIEMIWTSGNKLCNVGHTGLSNKGSSANNINNNNN